MTLLTSVNKQHVVKSIAILDGILSFLSFGFILTVLLVKGDDAVLSTFIDSPPQNKNQDKMEEDERTQTAFRWSFFGMIILISFVMHTVQLLMAWTLYGGAGKIKDDKVNAVKALSKWRSWSIILTVLLCMGILSFFLLFPHQKAFSWSSAAFQSIQILFQVGSIFYVGNVVKSLEVSFTDPIQTVDLKILYDL